MKLNKLTLFTIVPVVQKNFRLSQGNLYQNRTFFWDTLYILVWMMYFVIKIKDWNYLYNVCLDMIHQIHKTHWLLQPIYRLLYFACFYKLMDCNKHYKGDLVREQVGILSLSEAQSSNFEASKHYTRSFFTPGFIVR